MDNNTQNPMQGGNMNQNMNNVPRYVPEKPRSPVMLVIVIILILVAIVAALYFWGQSLTQQGMTDEKDSTLNANLSASNDLDSIEKDLNATDVNNSDKEMKDVEKDF